MNQSLASLYGDHLSTLRERADIALERGGRDHLVIPSGSLHVQVFDDREYPYAVNPQFKAWLPLTRHPGCWLVYTPGNRPRLVFLQPHDYWHVVPEAPSGYWVEHFDVDVVHTADDALARLPTDPARCAILGEPQSAQGGFVPDNPAAVLQYLDYQRSYKTPYEIEMMRRATIRGVRAHRAAERAFRAGASEFGIHLAYCQAAGQDASELPYGNIVALNRHGAVLHYTDRDRVPPTEPLSFLIDAGADHDGYACDITRTYAADPSSRFQALIDAVDAVQQQLNAGFRAGTDYRRLHLDAHLGLARVLNEFGLIAMSPESALESGLSAKFFPHGLGHPIGLQVHDVAGFAASDAGGTIDRPEGHPYLRMTRTLEPGMVMTNEPGIYFADLLMEELRQGPLAAEVDWDLVDEFRPYGGIRIEDNLLVTEADPVNLTRDEFAAQQG